MVYKKGPRYRVRPVDDIKEDMLEAKRTYGPQVRTMFLPAGNTIAMKTEDLAEACFFAKSTFPSLERITVYGSSSLSTRRGRSSLSS